MYADDTIISSSSVSIYTINNTANKDLMLLKTSLDENTQGCRKDLEIGEAGH